jgi:hypothetical protein
MSSLSISYRTDFSLYSPDGRDPKMLLHRMYDEKYRAYVSAVRELEEIHLNGQSVNCDAGDETEYDNCEFEDDSGVSPVAREMAEAVLQEEEEIAPALQNPAANKENVPVNLSRTYYQLPSFEVSKREVVLLKV